VYWFILLDRQSVFLGKKRCLTGDTAEAEFCKTLCLVVYPTLSLCTWWGKVSGHFELQPLWVGVRFWFGIYYLDTPPKQNQQACSVHSSLKQYHISFPFISWIFFQRIAVMWSQINYSKLSSRIYMSWHFPTLLWLTKCWYKIILAWSTFRANSTTAEHYYSIPTHVYHLLISMKNFCIKETLMTKLKSRAYGPGDRTADVSSRNGSIMGRTTDPWNTTFNQRNVCLVPQIVFSDAYSNVNHDLANLKIRLHMQER
jgi:hypothetical protein